MKTKPGYRPLRGMILLAAAFTLGGCAMRDAGHPANPPSIAQKSDLRSAERLLAQSRSLAKTFETRLGLAVAAADIASRTLSNEDGNSQRLVYNQACTEIGYLSTKVALPVTLQTPAGTYRLSFDAPRPTGAWNPAFFSKLISPSDIKNKSLVAKVPPSGYGGTLVGVHLPPDPRAKLLPRVGVSAPVTAVVNTASPAQPGDPIPTTLTLFDPSKRDSALVAGKKRPLAADLSAPFGYYPIPPKIGLLGMLRPEQFFEQEGLFLSQPYDPKKIPLVLIHGLMSDPSMWFPVLAALEADPALRGHYQFWVYAYPTGSPIGFSALRLREALAKMAALYPRSPDMVIVNHSLGGVITHLQVIDSGDALVQGIFKQNAPKIMALPDDSLVKRGLIFQSNPRISRVIFVAAPHRGAPLASNPIGEFGARLIRAPQQLLSSIGTTALQAAASAAGIKGTIAPNSINGLSPKSPLLVAMNTVPMQVPFHSIIGVAGRPKSPLEKTSDTVVPYWSAHQDAALSEKIVPYPHTAMFVKPEATNEIKRILKLSAVSSDAR